MTKTSPRRILRRRDSSRQAALTFLSNISLGTETSFSSSSQRETAAPSHSSSYLDDPTLPPITVTEYDSFSENGRPNLQRAVSVPFDKHPCKTASNNSLPNTEVSPIDGTEYPQDFSSSGKTRLRSNSLRFSVNTSLDSKKLKSNHPSRESLNSPSKENAANPEAHEGSDVENQENQDLKVIDSPNTVYRRRRRRSSASTLKSDSSSSSANSNTSPTSNDNTSLFRRKTLQRRSPPKTNTIVVNVNNQGIGHNLFSGSTAPLGILSILGYNDKKSKQGKHRDHSKQVDSVKRRKAESFARLLEPSNSLGSGLEVTDYDPTSLDDPELPSNDLPDFKPNKHRTVLSLSGLVGSLINHNTRPSDLKRESNELFRKNHPDVDPSLTLSQVRKIKAKLLIAARYDDLDLELSTVAKAYAYFEKLIFKNFVNKSNRRLIGATCLLLASKVNEPMGMSYSPLLESLDKHLDVTPKEITEQEFSVFASLDFELYLPVSEFMPHFERIIAASGDNKQDYLGTNPFYEFKQKIEIRK